MSTTMSALLGRTVHYRLTAHDAAKINSRRRDAAERQVRQRSAGGRRLSPRHHPDVGRQPFCCLQWAGPARRKRHPVGHVDLLRE